MEGWSEIMPEKSTYDVNDVTVGLLYSCLNEIVSFSHDCCDIASPNFIHRCILAEYRTLLIFKIKCPITTSPGHKTGQMGKEGYRALAS